MKDCIRVEGLEVEWFNFSAGEVQIKMPPMPSSLSEDSICVSASLFSSDSIMALLQVSETLDRLGYTDRYLVLHYIPYSRQDRACEDGESFSLKVFADLLNSCKYNSVIIYDAHSDVSPALIDNVDHKDFYPNFKDTDAIVAPDAGATKKIFKLCQREQLPMIQGIKHRDTSSGEITHTEIIGDVSGKVVWIVDDICDGGRTFIELSKVLYKQGAREVNLYVTYGLFSKGKGPLYQAGINNIKCLFDHGENDES